MPCRDDFLVRTHNQKFKMCQVSNIRSEKVHSSSNGPGRARSQLKTSTIEMFGPVGPKIGPTGPTISIVIVIGPDSAEPGLLLLLFAFSLRTAVGGPLAPIEKFFSKPEFGRPNGLLPPGNS